MGIKEGKKLRLKGKGEASPNGGSSGDIFLKINVADNEQFTKDGSDLIVKKLISFSEVCLGTKVEIEGLDGKKFIIKIAAGTDHGSRLRIKNNGLPEDSSGKNRGDLYVKIIVKIPKDLTPEQVAAVEKLEESGL